MEFEDIYMSKKTELKCQKSYDRTNKAQYKHFLQVSP